LDEVKLIAKEANTTMSDSELDSILKQLDLDNNDKVNYSEFLAATVDFSKHATFEKIRAMFEIFDI
jgi:Ca2+-binding EF-hand superfamily protein